MISRFFGCILTACVIAGCSSIEHSDGPIMPQKRRDFEEMKYADPALGRIPENIRANEHAFVETMKSVLDKGEQVQSFGQFHQVGPYNIGGRTRAFACDRTNPSILLAGGVSGGLWRSEDAGATWQLCTKPGDLHTVTCIVQDPREGKNNNWYYGTGELLGNSARISGNGIFKSTDNGKTWAVFPSTVSTSVPSAHAFAYAWRIIVDPVATSDVILVATGYAGIYRTSNGGANWTSVLATNSYFSDIVVTPDGVMYAGVSAFSGSTGPASKWGIYKSVDGISWKNITPSDMPNSTWRIVLGLVGSNTKDLFVVAETPGVGAKGLLRLSYETREQWHSLWKYHSNNIDTSSGTWENRSASIPLFGGRNGDFFTQQGYDMYVRVAPNDSNVVFLGGTNVYRALDAFRSTQNTAHVGGYGTPAPGKRYTPYLNHHPDQHDIVFHPTQPKVLWSANDGGVMRSDDFLLADSIRWIDLNRGYYTTQHYTISIRDSANDAHVMGGMQDNGTYEAVSNDSAAFWINRNDGDGSYSAYADSGRTIYASSQSGRINRIVLDDNGTEIGRTRVDPIGPTADDYLFINPFAIDPADQKVMYLPAGSIMYRNSDLTQIPLDRRDSTNISWDSLPMTRTDGSPITSVAVTKAGHTLYYGAQNGKVRRLDNANVGHTAPVELLFKSGMVNSISIHPKNDQCVVACYSNYGVISIYASMDGGANWSAVSGNLEETNSGGGYGPAVNWVAIVPYQPDVDVYVAATSTGLFFTSQLNGMSTIWMPLAEQEIGNVPTDMVVTRSSDKEIFVGTHGRGVFRGTITSLPLPADQPTLRSPANASKGIMLDTVLKWNKVSNGIRYTVEISSNAAFDANVQRFEGISSDSLKIADLIQGPTSYFWRVYANGEGGRSVPSETWMFSTAVRPPVLLNPPSGATDVPGSPVALTWEHVQPAISYDLEVATNLSFGQIAARINDITDTTSMIAGLESNKRYFWHVRSKDQDATGIWSARSSFTTGTLTALHEDEDSNSAFTVSLQQQQNR